MNIYKKNSDALYGNLSISFHRTKMDKSKIERVSIKRDFSQKAFYKTHVDIS